MVGIPTIDVDYYVSRVSIEERSQVVLAKNMETMHLVTIPDKNGVENIALSMDLVEEVNIHKDIKSIVEEFIRIVKEKDF